MQQYRRNRISDDDDRFADDFEVNIPNDDSRYESFYDVYLVDDYGRWLGRPENTIPIPSSAT
jgi:hypothetical protein